MSAVRNWKPLLKDEVSSDALTLKALAKLYPKTVIRPVYQREIRWAQDNMCLFVTHILRKGILNGAVMLYKLQADERPTGPEMTWECVDGQHRIFTAYHYINSVPVCLPGKKPFLISAPYKDEMSGATTYVFFKETDDTRRFAALGNSVAYMTEEEQDDFAEYLVDVKKICEPMTLDQRRDLFLAAQRGVPVRGSDLLKNHVELSLVRYISEEREWEPTIKALFKARLTIDPRNYWLHWVIRLYYITSSCTSLSTLTTTDRFIITDHRIGKDIKDKEPPVALNPDATALTAFGAKMDRFLSYLSGLPDHVKFSPCHFYALYAYIADAPDSRLVDLAAHLGDWADDSATKIQKKAWESRAHGSDDEERRMFFETDLDSLDSYTGEATPVSEPPAPRKPIGSKKRKALWERDFGSTDTDGKCAKCSKCLSFRSHWEASHILAHAMGGADDLDNLRINCRTCNRVTGAKHMDSVTMLPRATAGAGTA
jgi:hypothetical protein